MKIVEITMDGGVIQHIQIPEGVQVIVRDYDCEGCEDVVKDENGDDCVIHTWDHEPGLDAPDPPLEPWAYPNELADRPPPRPSPKDIADRAAYEAALARGLGWEQTPDGDWVWGKGTDWEEYAQTALEAVERQAGLADNPSTRRLLDTDPVYQRAFADRAAYEASVAEAKATHAKAIATQAGYAVDGDGTVFDWKGPDGIWSQTIGFASAQKAWEAAYAHMRLVSSPQESREKAKEAALARMCDEYAAWNKANGLNLGSADEVDLDALTPEQRTWIVAFSRRWQAVEAIR